MVARDGDDVLLWLWWLVLRWCLESSGWAVTLGAGCGSTKCRCRGDKDDTAALFFVVVVVVAAGVMDKEEVPPGVVVNTSRGCVSLLFFKGGGDLG